MDASTRAVLSAAGAVVFAAAALLGPLVLAGLAAVAALAFAVGWPTLLELPAQGGSRAVIALAGLGAVAVVAFGTGEPFLREVPVVVVCGVLLTFVHELVRADGRPRLVTSVSGTATGVLIAVTTAGWVAAAHTQGGAQIVVVGAMALAVGTATAVVPLSPWLGFVVASVVSGAVGAGLGAVLGDVTVAAGTVIGVAVGLLGATLRELFDRIATLSLRWAAVAAIVIPIAVTGTLVYVVGRVMIG